MVDVSAHRRNDAPAHRPISTPPKLLSGADTAEARLNLAAVQVQGASRAMSCATARIAGIMAAKPGAPSMIPLCHLRSHRTGARSEFRAGCRTSIAIVITAQVPTIGQDRRWKWKP